MFKSGALIYIKLKKNDFLTKSFLYYYLVTRTSFELVNVTLRGLCVKPLHQRAKQCNCIMNCQKKEEFFEKSLKIFFSHLQ